MLWPFQGRERRLRADFRLRPRAHPSMQSCRSIVKSRLAGIRESATEAVPRPSERTMRARTLRAIQSTSSSAKPGRPYRGLQRAAGCGPARFHSTLRHTCMLPRAWHVSAAVWHRAWHMAATVWQTAHHTARHTAQHRAWHEAAAMWQAAHTVSRYPKHCRYQKLPVMHAAAAGCPPTPAGESLSSLALAERTACPPPTL
jgi:hypothetical protein